MGDYRIGRADASDITAVLGVINETNRAFYCAIVPSERFLDPFLTVEELRDAFERMTFYAARSADRIVGVGVLEARGAGLGVVFRLYVLPAWQRRGVATALLQRIERDAATAGIREIVLWTDARADWAVAFYLRAGFDPVEASRRYGDPLIDEAIVNGWDALTILRKPL